MVGTNKSVCDIVTGKKDCVYWASACLGFLISGCKSTISPTLNACMCLSTRMSYGICLATTCLFHTVVRCLGHLPFQQFQGALDRCNSLLERRIPAADGPELVLFGAADTILQAWQDIQICAGDYKMSLFRVICQDIQGCTMCKQTPAQLFLVFSDQRKRMQVAQHQRGNQQRDLI
jgi:hypothetical protein